VATHDSEASTQTEARRSTVSDDRATRGLTSRREYLRMVRLKPKVGIVGYGVIGQRLADGVAQQQDMELAGVVDVAPTLSTRALAESGMALPIVRRGSWAAGAFDEAGIPVSGTLNDLLGEVDIILDSTPAGVGRANKELYQSQRHQGRLPGRGKRTTSLTSSSTATRTTRRPR